MTDSTLFSILTALSLMVALSIFLAQTVAQAKRREGTLSRSFNLLMTVFMLTWSVTELLEELLQPPFSTIWHYLHFFVMVSFAFAITRRWRWTTGKANEERRVEPKLRRTLDR